jgi:uncharacterized protein YciI
LKPAEHAGGRDVYSNMRKLLCIVLLISAAARAQAPASRQFLLRMEVVRSGLTFENMTEEERNILTAHGAYWKSLFDEGKLTFAGQCFDPKGLWGVIVMNAPSAEAAAALMNADPGVKAGVFRGEVVRFRTVFERGAPAER